MPDLRSSELLGSQSLLSPTPVAPGYLGCLCIQVEVGDKLSQMVALNALAPRLEDAMRQWLAGHPGTTPQSFITALERGEVTAADMGLYPRSDEQDVVKAAHQVAHVLRLDPVFAATLGIRK